MVVLTHLANIFCLFTNILCFLTSALLLSSCTLVFIQEPNTRASSLRLAFSDVRNGGLHCLPAVVFTGGGVLCLLPAAAQQWWMSFTLCGLCGMSVRALFVECLPSKHSVVKVPLHRGWSIDSRLALPAVILRPYRCRFRSAIFHLSAYLALLVMSLPAGLCFHIHLSGRGLSTRSTVWRLKRYLL